MIGKSKAIAINHDFETSLVKMHQAFLYYQTTQH